MSQWRSVSPGGVDHGDLGSWATPRICTWSSSPPARFGGETPFGEDESSAHVFTLQVQRPSKTWSLTSVSIGFVWPSPVKWGLWLVGSLRSWKIGRPSGSRQESVRAVRNPSEPPGIRQPESELGPDPETARRGRASLPETPRRGKMDPVRKPAVGSRILWGSIPGPSSRGALSGSL